MRKLYPLFSLGLIGFCACSPDVIETDGTGTFQMDFDFVVGADSLTIQSEFYSNAAGNSFNVSRLQYFVSGVELYSNGAVKFVQTSIPQLVNAAYSDTRTVTLRDVPAGRYDSIRFAYGVVPEYNTMYAFPLTSPDVHMYWPPSMGGGYHHMKMEGYWRDEDDFGGYAFHIGYDGFLLRIGLPINIKVESSSVNTLDLEMDVKKWFDEPNEFDLTTGVGYTMGDTLYMGYLLENGSGVFSVVE